jgi:glycosyltransferase involved in cell wall biosynthesis
MTNEASGPEIVEDGISGLLADPRDPLQLSACLLRLLGSPELRQTIGEAARHRTEAKFALKNLADATLEEYTSLLSRHS